MVLEYLDCFFRNITSVVVCGNNLICCAVRMNDIHTPGKFCRVDLALKIKRGVMLVLEIDEGSHSGYKKEPDALRSKSVTYPSETAVCVIRYSLAKTKEETERQRSQSRQVEKLV